MTSQEARMRLVSIVLSGIMLCCCGGVIDQHDNSARQAELRAAPATASHPGCVHGNRTYNPGERYRIDACTTCHCPRHLTGSGRPHCTVQDCMPTQNCFRFADRKSDSECCPTCVEYGCFHHGTVFASGQVVMETSCERCVCSPSGGPVVCSQKLSACPREQQTITCVDHEIDPENCCRRCPNGGNCWLNDQILPAGVTVEIGNCRKCSCPPAGHVTPFWRRERGAHAICSVDEECRKKFV